jgi:hypothetical protein
MPHTPGHTDPQQAGQAAAPPDEFELLRRRLKLRGAARGEEQQRDLNRRFAAAGTVPSGAAFKIRQQATEAAERQTSEDLQGVNIAQAQTQRQELAAQKEREFVGEQARLGREFAREERLSSQDFAAGEQAAQRSFLAAESALGRGFTRGEAELARSFAREEAATGRSFAQVQQKFQQDHEASMQALGIASNENLAMLDRELKQDGIDIQRMLAESQIETAKAEGVLNSLATFTNSIAPLREAGMNPAQITNVYKELDIGLPTKTIKKSILKNFPEFAGPPEAGTPPPGMTVEEWFKWHDEMKG